MTTKVDIDETAWTNAGLVFTHDTAKYRFMIPNRSDVVETKISGTQILLLDDRSAAHKALLAAMGLNA